MSTAPASPTSPVDLAPAHIRALPPYVPGRPPVQDGCAAAPCMMASNENPLGASPRALAALQAALADAAIYPDAWGHALKQALQRRFGVAPEQVLLGNGSSELIDLVARCLLRPGDEAVYAQYAFIAYPLAIKLADAVAVQVPAHDYGHDLPAMAAALTPRTRLVFLANPNNPTGTRFGRAALLDFLRRVPPQVTVLLDEAYTEYQAEYQAENQDEAERIDSFALVRDFPNLIVARTFSKAYGLAGLRVGYAVAQPAMAELLNRARPVFNVNALAHHAAAAALDDEAFLRETVRINREGMVQLRDGFARLGLAQVPSAGNFIAVDFAGSGLGAAEVFQRLMQAGYVLRPLAPYGLPQFLRVTVGLPAQNAGLLAALAAILGRDGAAA